MSWTRIVNEPAPEYHECEIPNRAQCKINKAGIGSLWHCDTCNRGYELMDFGWTGHPHWRKFLTES